MRQPSTAYPRVADRNYVKYVVIVGVLLFVVAGLMHVDKPEIAYNKDVTGASGLRGP